MVRNTTVALVALLAQVSAQGTLRDYRRAAAVLRLRSEDLAFRLRIEPHWREGKEGFYYRVRTERGPRFYLVDAATGAKRPAFDHEKLAAALSGALKQKISSRALDLSSVHFLAKEHAFEFTFKGSRWRCDVKQYRCKRLGPAAARPARRPRVPPHELRSPDGAYVLYMRNFNLYAQSLKTHEEFQLTRDGVARYAYGMRVPSLTDMLSQKTQNPRPRLWGSFSPDGTKLVTYRVDWRKAGQYTVVQSSPPGRGRACSYSYVYPLPGERTVPKAYLFVIDLQSRSVRPVRTPPLNLLWAQEAPDIYWLSGGKRFAFLRWERGFQCVKLIEVDPASGATRVLVEERSKTFVSPWSVFFHFFSTRDELLWASERDGWCHLYLYDRKSGACKRQVTRGGWVVRRIIRVDEKARQLYFLASGREKGRDPYLRHLYRVNLDGSGLILLTPGDGEHSVSFSPDGAYCIDTYSRVDRPPVTELRRTQDGSLVCELERANVEPLLRRGFSLPEVFAAPGRDGKTPMYGIVVRPSNFDPARKYPVVERIYTGPHGFHTPKRFRPLHRSMQALAELGFIVVAVDGMGTAKRSKAFHDVCYKNLGDGGLQDHIAWLKALAKKDPAIDVSRVGLYGGSAGGYDTVHALLTHPEFYKVGVAASGNHDHRLDKASWVEVWMGYPVGKHYEAQSNVTLAGRLEGKLLLAHGELDDNVHVSSTLRLVDALIKANKDFDLLIMPNRRHGLGGSYFTRRRWDYFVRHLLGVEPPAGFNLARP